MNSGDNSVTLQEGATVFLTAVTKSNGSGGGYIISSSDDSGEFVCLKGNNNWSLSTTTDIDDAYILDMNLTKGVYYFKGSNGCLGTDNKTTGSTVFANKEKPTFNEDNNVDTDEKNAAWTIAKVANPRLLPAMYFKWNGLDANAQVVANNPECQRNIDDGEAALTIYGLYNIDPNSYADLTGYRTLELIVTDGTPRLLFNSIEDAFDRRLNVYVQSGDPYIIGQPEITEDGIKWVIDLEKIYKEYGYVHLNAIKGFDPNTTATVTSAKLEQYADDTQLDLTINVWRKAGLGNNAADENNSQSVSVDFKDVQSFLGVNAVTTDMLKMVDENGGFVSMGSYDGWFGADGNPKEWGSGSVICAKFFEAVNSQTNSIGVFRIYNYLNTGNEGDVYSAKWAITANNKTVIYTINVHFINFAADKVSDQIGNGVAEDAKNLWINRSTNAAIKVYMGGWKYQSESQLASAYPNTSGTYTLHTLDKGKVNTQTDTWKKSGPEKSPNEIVDIQQATIDGYLYGSFGKDNARSEFLWENGVNPPFEYALAKRGSINGKGNPFTIPCFGAFLKFEPEQDGKVIAYVLQNGVLDMSTSKDPVTQNEIYGLTNNIGWRPVYIVDEAGNRLPENTAEAGKMPNGVMAETNQRIYVGMDHSQSVSEQPFVYWVNQYFETGKGKDHQNLKEYWLASGEKQEIMPPSKTGDGWISVSKAYVKYTFDVKAGKSYYIFSNDTKVGYCGFEFIPTNEPTDDITIPDNGDYASEAEWKSQVDEFAGKSYNSVTVNRTFHQGWNAICLPFSVTEDKMRELFGTTKDGVKQEDYELVIYNGAEPIHDGSYLRAHFFRHAYQDIIAWYPYMIYIPEGVEVLTNGTNSFTVENVTFDAYEDINVSSSEEYMPSGSGFVDTSKETDYTFKGHHYKHNVPAASYLVTPQGIQYYKNSVTMNAFRSYLAPNVQRDPSEIKILSATNFSNVLDDEHWNDATVINALAEEMGFFSQPSDVYSVSGLLVRQNATSLVGLPKGIYIVNGKKYFVK